MIHKKGAPADFDEWEKLGNKGWANNDVKPYMTKAENLNIKARMKLPKEDMEQHGFNGPCEIGYTHSTGAMVDFLDACEEVDIRKVADVNTVKGIDGTGPLSFYRLQRSATLCDCGLSETRRLQPDRT